MAELPKDQRVMRLREVMKFSGYKSSQLYEHVARGDFPKPIKLTASGQANGWLVSELEAWLESRVAARDGARANENA
jgi:prophage regulatory protein